MPKETRKIVKTRLISVYICFEKKRLQRIRRRRRVRAKAFPRSTTNAADYDGELEWDWLSSGLDRQVDGELFETNFLDGLWGFTDESSDGMSSSDFGENDSDLDSGDSNETESDDETSSLSSISSSSTSTSAFSSFESSSSSSDVDDREEKDLGSLLPPLRFNRQPSFSRRFRQWIRTTVEDMYKSRYSVQRVRLKKNEKPQIRQVLDVEKHLYPDKFRQSIRLSPTTFDNLVQAIESDPVFQNNSENQQLPVDEQLAVVLYRFGHFGNAASLQLVADWAGWGKGTVLLVTRRVLAAILRPAFLTKYVRMPTVEEKEEAKQWVEERSCEAWRDGWPLVDGTLIPLYARPHWYGESYFDRKCNYSLNVQVVSLPNLQIIDFTYGFTGSTHDSTAWEYTRFKKEHLDIMEDGEWIWADSAYPIECWVVAPYKSPYREIPENTQFNNYVSMVRVWSEHCIGFLKGRFPSLKGLRILIVDKKSHKFAGYWIASCIAVHNFAMADGRSTGGDLDEDPFIDEGLQESGRTARERPARQRNREAARSGKAKREELKKALQEALDEREHQRRHAEGFHFELDSEID